MIYFRPWYIYIIVNEMKLISKARFNTDNEKSELSPVRQII